MAAAEQSSVAYNFSSSSSASNSTGWRPVAHARAQDVTVPKNGESRIQLYEDFTIPDGHAEAALPIEVSPQRLVVNGSASPRIGEVNCTSPDGEYGAGEELNITVLFTSSIEWQPRDAALSDRWVGSAEDVPRRWVLGSTNNRLYGLATDEGDINTQWARGEHPTARRLPENASHPALRLATGCRGGDGCFVAEVQAFYCKANQGALALSWNGHVLPNLDVNLDQEQLKSELETLPGTDCTANCLMSLTTNKMIIQPPNPALAIMKPNYLPCLQVSLK